MGEYKPPTGWDSENAAMTPEAAPRDAIDPGEIEEQRRRGWPDFHPETYCHRCGRPNVASWSAPSPLWNAVMQAENEEWGIVCPPCFAELAEPIVGPLAHWRFAIEAEAAQPATPVGALDVERLARALNQAELDGDFGQGYSPEHAAAAIADLYAYLAAASEPAGGGAK